jgi:phosphoribosylformylglycinamidine synthase subunit PurSL
LNDEQKGDFVFARIEVAVRPDLLDSSAQSLLRRIELASPNLRQKIRWARMLDVYWLDLPVSREEVIPAITEICWDKVLQWVFTGNLIPSAAGKTGGLLDLMELAPYRPGRFWGVERRFRPGVTDNVARTLLEAFEIVLGKDLSQARTSSGGLLLLEGAELDEDSIAFISREVFCNELIETWTILPEDQLKKNDRFHQERVKYDLPKVGLRTSSHIESYTLENLSDTELSDLSKKKLWALSLVELKTIREYFSSAQEVDHRKRAGLSHPTDVEMEVLAQTWSEHCKHKIFNAKIHYVQDGGTDIPKEIDGLFKTTISGTTSQLAKPWLLSVFSDNAGICAFDEEDAFCIKVETHNSPSALDPYGGALTGIVGVNRDILGCGLGAKPIFNTDVFCVAPPDYSKQLPDRILHPRRILDGIRRGVEHGGNKSGIPTINGALVFDERYLGKPLVYCGTGGFIPRKIASENCETKKVMPGDRICMVGGRIGKDGIHGATFSSLALDEASPLSAVQLGDPLTQKRMTAFLLEARDLGLYRAITDNGAGGLSSSVGEMALLSGGATFDVSLAKTKYSGLKPFELVVSESQERMTLAVPPAQLSEFLVLARKRGVEVSDLGEFTQSGRLVIQYEGKPVADLDLKFLHHGVPKMELAAEWKMPQISFESSATAPQLMEVYQSKAAQILLNLMSRPNIASKEWLIRQYDHEVQGMSVVKPLHTVAPGTPHSWSGPNDAGVVKPKVNSDEGLAVGCGINPKLSDLDPYLMAQSAVDEAVRNVLCVGAEFGKPESVLALVDNFCWPDPVDDPLKTAWLVRACFGLREAALALSTPLVSGKDSMKNDYRGRQNGAPITISVPPTLLMTAVAKVSDIKQARTAGFKATGDLIYLIGNNQYGLLGSEFQSMMGPSPQKITEFGALQVARPDWELARKIYTWMGGAIGKQQSRLKSLHDVSDGGVWVAVAESLLARGVGANLEIPGNCNPWEFSFGEGFHSFVSSIAVDDAAIVEAEWQELGIPFLRLGSVENQDRIEVWIHKNQPEQKLLFSVSMKQLRSAWLKEGYWE